MAEIVVDALATCRVCGCTDDRACAGGCSWVPDPWQHGDLCSACLPADPAEWLEPPQDLTEFEIGIMRGTVARAAHVRVDHVPCQTVVLGLPDDPDHLDVDDLLERVATHRCDHVAEPRNVSQIIDVETDGGTVTAAIHGARPLDAQEQTHMAEVVRAGIRADREKRREEARQRDEDVRAVAALLELGDASFRGTWLTDWDDAKSALRERFADRIAELRQRDAEREPAPAEADQGAMEGP